MTGRKSKKVKEKKERFKKKDKHAVCGRCEHNPFTHFPMDRENCKVCRDAKPMRHYARTKEHGPPDSLPKPEKFADQLVADHKIITEEDQSRNQDKVACIIQDRATSWLKAYPAPTNKEHRRNI